MVEEDGKDNMVRWDCNDDGWIVIDGRKKNKGWWELKGEKVRIEGRGRSRMKKNNILREMIIREKLELKEKEEIEVKKEEVI